MPLRNSHGYLVGLAHDESIHFLKREPMLLRKCGFHAISVRNHALNGVRQQKIEFVDKSVARRFHGNDPSSRLPGAARP
jgi:hypothetical protein